MTKHLMNMVWLYTYACSEHDTVLRGLGSYLHICHLETMSDGPVATFANHDWSFACARHAAVRSPQPDDHHSADAYRPGS